MRFRHVHRRTKALIAAVVLTSSAQLFATPASWTAAVDGNWTDGTKWSTNPAYPNNGTPSGTSYDATIAAAGGAGGGAYTVTLNSSVAVDSLTLNAAGATLSHTAGTLTTPSINLQQGTYTLAGGSITGATITGSAGAQINVGSATKPGRLDGVTLSGVTLALSSGGDEDTNGPITLQNGGVTFAGYSQMLMWGSSTGFSGTGQVTFNGGAVQTMIIDSTMTVGPGITVNTSNGAGSQLLAGNVLTNQGAISAAQAAWLRTEAGTTFNNYGTLSAQSGGTLEVVLSTPVSGNALNNYGTISTTGGWMQLDDLKNYGTVTVVNGNLTLDGVTDLPSTGTFSTPGTNVFLTGTLANAGRTFTVEHSLDLLGFSTITGGSVVASPGATVNVPSGSPELHGVQIDTDIGVSSYLSLLDGCTLANNRAVSLLPTPGSSQKGELVVDSLGGTGRILLTYGTIVHTVGASPVIGADITLAASSGTAALQNEGTGALVNRGTFQAVGSTQELDVYSAGVPGGFQNVGSVVASAGGKLYLQSFSNAGAITATGGATLTLAANVGTTVKGGTWSNTGTITVTNSTLNLGGSSSAIGSVAATGSTVNFVGNYTAAQLGSIAYDNTAVKISTGGVIDNTSQTIQIVDGMADLTMTGGRINGGTIAAAAGRKLVIGTSGYLNGVTLAAPAVLNSAAALTVGDAVTFAAGGSLSMLGGTVNFPTGQSFAGAGEVVFNGTPGLIVNQLSGGSLPSGITVRTGTSGGRVAMWNAGLVSSQTANQLIEVDYMNQSGTLEAINGGRVTTAGTFSNSGTVRADTGGSIQFNDTWSNSGTITSAGGASLALAGTWSNTGSVSAVDSTLVLAGSTSNFGAVSVTNTPTLFEGAFTTAQVTSLIRDSSPLTQISGTIDNTNATLDVGPAFPLQFAGGTLTGGSLLASGGGQVVIPAKGTPTFDGVSINADVSVAAGASLSLAGSWSNNATIHLPGATLWLGGTFAAAQIGSLDRDANSLVAISGTLTNTGETFSIDPVGRWRVGPGLVDGGTIAASGGHAVLQVGAPGVTGFLWGVTLATDASVPASATASVRNGLVLNSSLSLSGTLTFTGTTAQTLSGSGEVVFDSATSAGSVRAGSGASFTIAPGMTVRTGAGGGTVGLAGSSCTNQGTISARTAGKTITLAASMQNQGVIEARGGGAVLASAAFTNTGTVSADAGSAVTFNNNLTWAGGSIGGSGNVNAAGAVSVTGDVTKSGTGSLRVGGTFTLAADKKLDLGTGKLILATGTVGTASGTTYTGVQGMVQAGRNGGAWTGPGIVTTLAGANDYTTLGVARAADALGIATTATAGWAGQTVKGSDTLVLYTYGGDANVDGHIDIDDYTQIDSSVSAGGALKGWYNGDFNYDGNVDIDDYTIIDSNIAIQGAPFSAADQAGTLAGVAAVPEPKLLALPALASVSLLRRRRRRALTAADAAAAAAGLASPPEEDTFISRCQSYARPSS